MCAQTDSRQPNEIEAPVTDDVAASLQPFDPDSFAPLEESNTEVGDGTADPACEALTEPKRLIARLAKHSS